MLAKWKSSSTVFRECCGVGDDLMSRCDGLKVKISSSEHTKYSTSTVFRECPGSSLAYENVITVPIVNAAYENIRNTVLDMVLFDRVSKAYLHGIAALSDVTLKIEDGEFVFLVGPSGAGKTTMLRMINQEILPSSGQILVDDMEVSKLPAKKLPFLRRKVGFIFQDFKLLSDRTVSENIALGLEILDWKQKDVTARIRQVLDFVKLSNKQNYFPRQLSLGEQQRVSIARAIAGETKILLADEPTGNLDPKTSWEILKILSTINKNGTTIIMATHNADIVNSMKKRVIKLVDGKVVKDEKKSGY